MFTLKVPPEFFGQVAGCFGSLHTLPADLPAKLNPRAVANPALREQFLRLGLKRFHRVASYATPAPASRWYSV